MTDQDVVRERAVEAAASELRHDREVRPYVLDPDREVRLVLAAYESALPADTQHPDPFAEDRLSWVEWAVVSVLTHYERAGLDPAAPIIAGRVNDVLAGRTPGLEIDDPALEHVSMPCDHPPTEERR